MEKLGEFNIQPLEYPEIFIALVAPTGSDSALLCEELSTALQEFGYDSEVISLSSLIESYGSVEEQIVNPLEFERIKSLMQKGDELRTSRSDPTFVAKMGIVELRRRREMCLGPMHGDSQSLQYCPKKAFIVRSFKRPEEVHFLRDIYGQALKVISIYTPYEQRLAGLSLKLAKHRESEKNDKRSEAMNLMHLDEHHSGLAYGQNTRDTFPLADYFMSTVNREELKIECRRFLGLFFGDPFITPNRDEVAMFSAYGASLRSCDLSRQVGAAIAAYNGDVLTNGCNEVPSPEGGLYWADQSNRMRDFELGYDSNAKIKKQLLQDLIEALSLSNDKISLDVSIADGLKRLDLIEFGRAVHAEMAALSSAAFNGISVKGARLFSTTFPCHLCARHIVACGISEVIFIEPYPKSRASELFADSIDVDMNYLGHRRSIDESRLQQSKVKFRPFLGVAPRAYVDFFKLEKKRKDKEGKVSKFLPMSPNFKIFFPYHLTHELAALQSLQST
jgi:deoxycytidylate deaminase